MWMLPYARSILRDEFGKESTISVSNPTTFGQATERARKRINKLLEQHGLEVTSIVTPRPRFSAEYEELIELRNQTENELSVIGSNLQRAETERSRRLAEVDRDQNKIMQEKRAEPRGGAGHRGGGPDRDPPRGRHRPRSSKVAAGQAALSADRQRAVELKGQLEAQYTAQARPRSTRSGSSRSSG
jgi:hypothetical protein